MNEYAKKYEWVKQMVENGYTVLFCTYTRATKITAKTIGAVILKSDGIYIKSGKTCLCHNYSALRAVK